MILYIRLIKLLKYISIFFYLSAFFLILTSGGMAYLFFIPNFSKEVVVLIPRKEDSDERLETLNRQIKPINHSSFSIASQILNLSTSIKSGRYEIKAGMNNYTVIRKISSGKQDPIKISFISTRTLDELTQKIAAPLEIDPDDLNALLSNPAFVDSLGFKSETLISMFIPNTYQTYWNITPEALIKRFRREYDAYWTPIRKAKAQRLNLTPFEVSVLASIVQAETYRDDERPRIAGVYINRLRDGWKLNADPTVIFAWQDFSMKRVLLKHLQIDSPYNTYKYYGLPPGPINCPSVSSLEAVLNFEQHKYFFFCAKNDFSGYHIFTEDYAQHLKIAADYQKALNEIIKR